MRLSLQPRPCKPASLLNFPVRATEEALLHGPNHTNQLTLDKFSFPSFSFSGGILCQFLFVLGSLVAVIVPSVAIHKLKAHCRDLDFLSTAPARQPAKPVFATCKHEFFVPAHRLKKSNGLLTGQLHFCLQSFIIILTTQLS